MVNINIENIIFLIIGMLIITFIWIFVSLYKKFKLKREYILPELNNMVQEIHNNLKQANTNCINLRKAFIDIEKQNA